MSVIFRDESAIAFDRSELRGYPGVEDAHALPPQEIEQLVSLLVADHELHLDRHVRGEFEEVLLVQDAVAAIPRDRAKGRASVDAELLRLLEQPFEQCDMAMGPILVDIEAQD